MDIRGMTPVNLVALAKEHSGQWVALDPDSGAVLACGGSAKEVVEAAEAHGAQQPLILLVSNDYGQLAPWHA